MYPRRRRRYCQSRRRSALQGEPPFAGSASRGRDPWLLPVDRILLSGLSLFCLGLAPRMATLPSSMQEKVPRAQRRLNRGYIQYITGMHSFGIAGGWVYGVAELAISQESAGFHPSNASSYVPGMEAISRGLQGPTGRCRQVPVVAAANQRVAAGARTGCTPGTNVMYPDVRVHRVQSLLHLYWWLHASYVIVFGSIQPLSSDISCTKFMETDQISARGDTPAGIVLSRPLYQRRRAVMRDIAGNSREGKL